MKPGSKIIGLAVGQKSFLLAEIAPRGGRNAVQQFAEFAFPENVSLATPEKLGNALGQFLKEKRFSTRDVVIGLPAKRLVTRRKEVPAASPAVAASTLRLQAEGEFSSELDNLVMDFAGTPNTSSPTTVLLIATNRDVLDQCMVMAKSAGLRVHGITSTTAALGRATSRLPGGNGWVLHVGQTGAEVVVQHGQDPAHLRHLNVPDNGSPEAAAALAGEIRRMMAAIPKNGTPMTLAVWRGPSENGQAGQGNILEQRLSMPVTTPDLDKLVATDSRDANAYAPAVAVALSAVEPAGLPVDFLHSRLAPPTPPRISPAKQLAIVGGVLAVLLVGGAVFHLNSKDRQLNDLVTKNKANETKVKNALTDESRLKEAQLWIRNGPHFVAVLRDISRLFPTQSNTVWATRLNNMRDIDSWEISGKTTSEQQARALLNSFLQSDRFSNAKLAYVQEDQAQAGRGNQQLYTFRIQFTYHGE